jgi:stage II sporulation protein D
MTKRVIAISLLIVINTALLTGQVRIRLFSLRSPEAVIFSVTEGKYELETYDGKTLLITKGEPVVVSRFDGKLAVKTRTAEGIVCDSVLFSGKTGDDSFSLQVKPDGSVRQYYSNNLQCFADLETIVLINICDIEKYISGVVRAEGGNRQNIEYYKTQAVIARTYLFKYFDRHLNDRYNLCDNTHCQAFHGLSSDSIIKMAVSETRGQVILTHDSALIMSAFHSNCGGETSSSEDVWLSSQTYLKRVIDPYCISSRNAIWNKSYSMQTWLEYIIRSGYSGRTNDPADFSFVQKSRSVNYATGTFSIPLKTLRAEMNLKSTFFSVISDGDKIILKGRGYGHGVGLCQEGAMVMASKGIKFNQIIDFYYTGVIISDIKNAVILNSYYGTPTP